MDTYTHALAERAAPKVAILMGTFNGQRFISEQLDSILQQSHTNWELHISDDGSTDNTVETIKSTGARWPNCGVSLRSGPRIGFVANFLSLACDTSIQADYYAFSDQDDVWERDKLERALCWLQAVPADKPAMYCSRTRLIDESGKVIGFSPLFKRQPSFKNALVQSIAGANTMVFNGAARELLITAGFKRPVVSHDWWIYMLITGFGGVVLYDPIPSISYRQHVGNLVGSNVGFAPWIQRMRASMRGRFRRWNDVNIHALEQVEHGLVEENMRTLDDFKKMRAASPVRRLFLVQNCGVYRQTAAGNIILFGAACLGKI